MKVVNLKTKELIMKVTHTYTHTRILLHNLFLSQ